MINNKEEDSMKKKLQKNSVEQHDNLSAYPALAVPTPIRSEDLQTRPDYLMSCHIAASSRCTLYQMGVRV